MGITHTRRSPEGARAAMRDHLSIASATYGRDYDQDLDMMAQRALRRLGATESLDAFLEEVLPAEPARAPR